MKKIKTIEVGASLFEENDRIAGENRILLKKHGVFALNVMGSPGSGKTTVLEKTIDQLRKDYSFAVIEGDIQGSLDGERLEKFGIPVVQINTGGACHLDANMVAKGLENIPLEDTDILFIENVGNLVCPAEFDIGTDVNIIISSVPEGEEKPLKYPLMFRISTLCLLNKIDIAPHTDFSIANFTRNLKTSAPDIKLISLSAKMGEGFKEWTEYLSYSLIASLSQLSETPSVELKGRVVIAGLGDRMKGDDGAGCLAAEILQKKIQKGAVKVINAENAVENYLGAIEKFKPDMVVIIDAVDFGGKPGDVKVMERAQLMETTSSTHTFSLPLIIRHISSETGAKCKVIGIQPKSTAFGEDISPEVRQSVLRLTEQLLS
ncbi:MAG: hydrogenase nickel incorporation protein HypB [Candidatus Omnitrophica bacterium]|nr:hydrogenase nickel incorporation protein HypB [Candidatus Omnitrophota bacterium]